MLNEESAFLNVLDTLLGSRGKDTLSPCIRDLVEHGLDLARFAAGERTTQRQDITLYLAAWSRHAGLSDEEARAWLADYCVARLVPDGSAPSRSRPILAGRDFRDASPGPLLRAQPVAPFQLVSRPPATCCRENAGLNCGSLLA